MNPNENINYTAENVANNGNNNVKKLLVIITIASLAFLLFRKRLTGQANQSVYLPNNVLKPITTTKPKPKPKPKPNLATKYFSIREITKGKSINQSTKSNIIQLITRVLDPLRRTYGKPIVVEKGYNPHWLGLSYLPNVIRYMKADFATGKGVEIRPLANRRNDLKKLIQIAVQQRNFDKIVVEKNRIYISYSNIRNAGVIYKYNGKNGYANITYSWQTMI